MKMNINLHFPGNCAEAFALYRKVFGVEQGFSMKYSEAPGNMPVSPEWKEKILHTSIPLGSGLLMGSDTPGGKLSMGGFEVSVETRDEAEAKRIFAALKEDGSVQMEMAPTFWSPLFGMCTDKYGVAWMVALLAASEA